MGSEACGQQVFLLISCARRKSRWGWGWGWGWGDHVRRKIFSHRCWGLNEWVGSTGELKGKGVKMKGWKIEIQG